MRNPKTHRSARPTKNLLNITYHGRSPAVERALTDFGAEESFGRAAQRFKEHYGWEMGRTSVLRIVECHAQAAEKYVHERLKNSVTAYDEPVAKRPGAEAILVELDGCELRTGTYEELPSSAGTTPIRQLPKRKRVEAWRDTRVGFARKLESLDKTYIGRMDSYNAVGEQLFAAAVAQGLSEQTKVIAVADGGNGLREELDARFSGLKFILDRPHFKSHLYATAEAMGLKGEARESWVRKIVGLCETGNIATVLQQLRTLKGKGKKRRQRLLKYLTRFRDAVHYELYRAAGYPTGSGEVESAHRYIPQKRLKIAGACWHPDTINPMLNLRIMRENGWWEDYWQERKAA